MRLLALLLLGAGAAGGYLATEAFLLSGDFGFPLDDSWIHLQFARNLARGDGLSYAPGELVTGSTAPLWTGLLAVLLLLPGNPVLWVKAAGVACYLAGIHATWRLGRELGLARGLAALAAGLTLGTYWLVWSALSGMEVAPFIVVSLWGIILHLRERRQVSGYDRASPGAPSEPARPAYSLFFLGVGALLRPEGLLLLGLAVADRLLVVRRAPSESGELTELRLGRPPWRPLLAGLGLAALVLVPVIGFYAAVGGSPLPTTFGAKTGAARSWLPDARYLYTVAGIFMRPQPFMLLLAGAGVVQLIRRLGRGSEDQGLLLALWVVGLPLAYSLLTPQGKHLLVGNFGRYYFPLFPPLVLLGTLGLQPAAAVLSRPIRAGRWRLPVRGALLLLLVLPTALTLVSGATRYVQNVADVQDGDVRLARLLADHLPAEAVLAVQDIGALGYFLPNRLVDLSGIVSPEVQAYTKQAVSADDPYGQAGMRRFIEERRPDYLVVFPQWYPGLVQGGGFRPVLRLAVPGNVTLAGDEIVVYATPWTRHRLRVPGEEE
jgi:hypothetical protein